MTYVGEEIGFLPVEFRELVVLSVELKPQCKLHEPTVKTEVDGCSRDG